MQEIDGSNRIRVSRAPQGSSDEASWYPVWSPDGRRIAFISDRDGNQEIYVGEDTDEPNSIRLTTDDADDRFPAWSPDSNRIAFQSLRDGNWEIYVMDVD